MKKMGQKKFAGETYKKIRWVVNLYHNWRITRNKNPDVVPILVDLDRPETIEERMLSYTICCFITEIKKLNGQDYPPRTIYEIVMCLQIHLETQGIFWKLLDDSDSAFVELRYTCNNLMKECASSGLGSQVKQAEVISYSDENFLWDNGFLDMTNLEQLV